MKLHELIQRGVMQYVDENKDAEAEAADCFRGSSTPLVHNNLFVADSSSHCPRMAMMRRAHLPTNAPKGFKDYASHHYGRAMEALVKKNIIDADIPGIVTAEEEGFKAELMYNGQIIYSARPDLVVFYNGIPLYVCEFKSIQSNSTAEQIFVEKMPKLGACIQCAAQMMIHDIPAGVIGYFMGHWVKGYSFKTKKSLSFDPGFVTFECAFDSEGWFTYDDHRTIIHRDAIQNSILLVQDYWERGMLPEQRPLALKANGSQGAYGCCDYCDYGDKKSGVCSRAEGFKDGLSLENFKDIVREAFIL